MAGRAQGNLAGLWAGAGSGSAHQEPLPFSLQTTRRRKSSTASATVRPPASSPLPGLCCSCHSCCCKPHDGVRHSRPEGRNWAQEAGAATLTCPGVPPKAPILGATPTIRTSCHPAASKRVSIRGFNPKEVSRPGGAIPALKPKKQAVQTRALRTALWEPSWKESGSHGGCRARKRRPSQRAGTPGRTD